jgi:hypothetical protein
LEPERASGAEAAEAIKAIARLENHLAGARIRLAKRVDATVTGGEGEDSKADWLAKHTGQSPADAKKDVEASEQLDQLAATDEAVRNGELSPTQAREVAAAAAQDPAAELTLLATAKNGSVPELRRQAKRVKAAASDDAAKNRAAHENRNVFGGVDEDTKEGWLHGKGPAASLAEFWAHLEPWIQAEFDKARREGRTERRGAYAFDALMAAMAFASETRRGGGRAGTVPAGPPVSILARVDATAMARGHTEPGETCEIDGLGPVPVDALRQLLPQAAIDLIVTNGVDVWNITHFGRRATTRQQVVLDWLGVECTRQGCGATRHLQVDHRIDWATIHLTELRNLDWLCVPCHRRKTHQGWALVDGTGKRPMVPSDHPDHPHNRAGADPPKPAAA